MAASAWRMGCLWMLLATAAMADDVPDLLKKSGCSTCHDEIKARIGPSFKSMADRHRGDPQAALERFSTKLRPGAGHPGSALDAEQIKQVTDWILQH